MACEKNLKKVSGIAARASGIPPQANQMAQIKAKQNKNDQPSNDALESVKNKRSASAEHSARVALYSKRFQDGINKNKKMIVVYNGPNGGRRYSVIPLVLRGGLTEETKKNRYALVYFEGSNTVNLLRMDRVVWTQVSNESFDLEAVIKKYGKDPRIQAESNATSSYQAALGTALKLSDGKAKEPNLDKIQQVASAHAAINPDEGAWLGRIGKLLKLTYSDQTITGDEIAQLLQLSEGEGLNQPTWVEEEYGYGARLISGPRISAILHVAGKDFYGIHCFWADDDRPIKTLPKANGQHKENDKETVLSGANDTTPFYQAPSGDDRPKETLPERVPTESIRSPI